MTWLLNKKRKRGSAFGEMSQGKRSVPKDRHDSGSTSKYSVSLGLSCRSEPTGVPFVVLKLQKKVRTMQERVSPPGIYWC